MSSERQRTCLINHRPSHQYPYTHRKMVEQIRFKIYIDIYLALQATIERRDTLKYFMYLSSNK